MDIQVTRAEHGKAKPEASTLGFGKIFTDHMFRWSWNIEEGWHNPRIVPFENLSIHPASTVLHYGAEIFEGLKAYRRRDGKVQLFRPIENIRRMNNSAERLCLPQLPEEEALEALLEFVRLEQDWTPSEKGTSLYLRPFLFGNDESLGVHTVKSAEFIIIASPVGSYYTEGLNPVKILIEDQDVRAVRGGTGYAKCGGNYAASTRAGERAAQMGYSQVLWLDGVQRKYIEEVGAMNVMFKIGDEIVTPMLSGSILPGITRMSCIELLRNEGYNIQERLLPVEELHAAMHNGTLAEAWGCGTAAVISPIGEFSYQGNKYVVNNNEIGALSQHLYDTLTGIQWGELEDTYGWTVEI